MRQEGHKFEFKFVELRKRKKSYWIRTFFAHAETFSATTKTLNLGPTHLGRSFFACTNIDELQRQTIFQIKSRQQLKKTESYIQQKVLPNKFHSINFILITCFI